MESFASYVDSFLSVDIAHVEGLLIWLTIWYKVALEHQENEWKLHSGIFCQCHPSIH